MREGAQRDRIVAAAKRRFAHFGISKTTLTEIADDLSLTKQALNYYFTDKASLIREVTAGVLSQYTDALGLRLAATASFYDGLQELIGLRIGLYRQYYLFFAQLEGEGQWLNRAARAMLLRTGRQEQQLLEARMNAAVDAGELRPVKSRAVVRLLLDTLTTLGRAQRGCTPDEKMFNRLEQQQRGLVALIYDGLGKIPWKDRTEKGRTQIPDHINDKDEPANKKKK